MLLKFTVVSTHVNKIINVLFTWLVGAENGFMVGFSCPENS